MRPAIAWFPASPIAACWRSAWRRGTRSRRCRRLALVSSMRKRWR
jgi:hypothetical protein